MTEYAQRNNHATAHFAESRHASSCWRPISIHEAACLCYAEAPTQPEQGLRVASVTCARGACAS
jgi:hypothetical protein